METAKDFCQQGIELHNQGDFIAAIASFERAIEIKPDEHQPWFNRGGALMTLGRYEEEITSYNRAIEIKPDDPNWLGSVGVLP